MMTITEQQGSLQVRVPVSLIVRIRIEAAKRRLLVRDVVVEAMEAYLPEEKKERQRRAS